MIDFSLFHFLRPNWLFVLIPVIIGLLFVLRHKLSRSHWENVCDKELMPFILDDSSSTRQYWPFTVISLASILSILALSGPTWQQLPTPIFNNNKAVVIALDLSLSMNAMDIKPSRLTRARYKIEDIFQKRKDGLTGLIVYAGDAFTVTPLTHDIQTIKSQLNALKTDIMPTQGSNTVAAIQQAVDLLKQSGQTQGSILLITDEVKSNLAQQINATLGTYQLSILGVGTADGAPIPIGPQGVFLKDRQGDIIVPKLDPSILIKLATNGGGIYRTLNNNGSDINDFLSLLEDPVYQSADKTENTFEQWDDFGPWILLLVLPLAALYFRKGLLLVPLVLFNYPQQSYAFEWQDVWQTPDQQAQSLFEQQKYEHAVQLFQDPQWKAAAHYKSGQYEQASTAFDNIDTADGHYNKGNALAKSGQLELALTAYQDALSIDPKHEDALFNKDLVEQALKQQEQQQKNDQNQQQDNAEQQDKKDQQQDESSQGDGDKQEQQESSDQNQPQDESEQSQETKDEQQKQDEKQQSESKPEKQEQTETEAEQQEQAEIEADPKEMTEQDRANAQWLQRIPDDPSGLLKRKFKYQYGQRNNGQKQEQLW